MGSGLIMTNDIHSACNRGARHSFYWLMHRLAIVTLRMVGVEPPVYSLCLVHPFPASIVFLAMCTQGDSISSCKFYLDFLPPFRSQTLVNCTSLDSLRCVVYFYNKLRVICATSKHLERDKCWQVGCSYGYLNRSVRETMGANLILQTFFPKEDQLL